MKKMKKSELKKLIKEQYKKTCPSSMYEFEDHGQGYGSDINSGDISRPSKEDQLKVAYDALEKAEMDGDIRDTELALAAIDLLTSGEKLNENEINEVFEWWQPLLALGASIGLAATAFFAVGGPGMILNPHMIASGDNWGDVLRHYKNKFKDKISAKKLKKEDVLELVNLIQSNVDTSDLKPGVKKYMKGLMNKLENEMNKDESELDKNKLLVLLRNVQDYAARIKVKTSLKLERDKWIDDDNEINENESSLVASKNQIADAIESSDIPDSEFTPQNKEAVVSFIREANPNEFYLKKLVKILKDNGIELTLDPISQPKSKPTKHREPDFNPYDLSTFKPTKGYMSSDETDG